jgi:hypothetical protein
MLFLTPGVAAANIDFCPQKAKIEKPSVKLSLSGIFLAKFPFVPNEWAAHASPSSSLA